MFQVMKKGKLGNEQSIKQVLRIKGNKLIGKIFITNARLKGPNGN